MAAAREAVRSTSATSSWEMACSAERFSAPSRPRLRRLESVAAMKESPAPTVSATSMENASRSLKPLRARAIAPEAPRVTVTSAGPSCSQAFIVSAWLRSG